MMALAIEPVDLKLTSEVHAYIGLRTILQAPVDIGIKQEAYRMAELIRQRVASGGDVSVRINPTRIAPNLSNLIALIQNKWVDQQQGKCALCGGELSMSNRNKMLQASADRIDSGNGAYNETNVQITHLACNWAKNQYGLVDYVEWLQHIKRSS